MPSYNIKCNSLSLWKYEVALQFPYTSLSLLFFVYKMVWAFIFFSDKLKIICMNRYVPFNKCCAHTGPLYICVFNAMKKESFNTRTPAISYLKWVLTCALCARAFQNVSVRICMCVFFFSFPFSLDFHYTDVWLISIQSTFFSAFVFCSFVWICQLFSLQCQ